MGLGFSRRKEEALFQSADVENFNDGDAGDTEEVGSVGGEEAGLNDAEDLKDESGGGACDADVETCVEKIVFIFEKAKFESGIAWAFFDLAHPTETDSIDGDLEGKKDSEGDQIGGIHSISFKFPESSGFFGNGEMQTILREGAGTEESGLEKSAEEKGEEEGLGEARKGTPRSGGGRGEVGEKTPSGGNDPP